MTIIKDNVFCDYCLKSNSFEGFNQNEFNKLYDNLKENENILKEKYDLVKIQPVDMFPHTQHVENVILLVLKAQ